MSDIIVSYDGTPNDDDGLALGKMLSRAGATLSLAYVRHSREFDPRREELADHDAHRRLEQGAIWLEQPELDQHVVVSPSTWTGLAELAANLGARVIAFGSDYRTSPGTVTPGTSAQHLLEGGPVAVAVAPAGIRTKPDAMIDSVAISPDEVDEASAQTARAIGERLGVPVHDDVHAAGLIIVGSAPGGTPGRVRLSGTTRNRLSAARAPVLVIPAGAPIQL